jgi:hypothetical protein
MPKGKLVPIIDQNLQLCLKAALREIKSCFSDTISQEAATKFFVAASFYRMRSAVSARKKRLSQRFFSSIIEAGYHIRKEGEEK